MHSESPSLPFFLYVSPRTTRKRDATVSSGDVSVDGHRQYVGTSATLTADITQALAFIITAGGQLMSGSLFFSTSGLVASEPFEPQSYTAAISTLFSNIGNNLIWTSDAFAGQQALFCTFGSVLEVVFKENLPAGCILVELGIVPISDVSMTTTSSSVLTPTSKTTDTGNETTSVSSTPTPSTPGSVHSKSGTGNPFGCLNSPASAPALSGKNHTVPTLEACLDFCLSDQYFGVQYGNVLTESTPPLA